MLAPLDSTKHPVVRLHCQNHSVIVHLQFEKRLLKAPGLIQLLIERLLRYCEKILNQCDEACGAIEDLHNLKGGTLIIGASQTTGTYLMPRMIGVFRQKFPDVSVQLQVHSTRRTGWSVANGQLDLAIIGGELPTELNELLEIIPYKDTQRS